MRKTAVAHQKERKETSETDSDGISISIEFQPHAPDLAAAVMQTKGTDTTEDSRFFFHKAPMQEEEDCGDPTMSDTVIPSEQQCKKLKTFSPKIQSMKLIKR